MNILFVSRSYNKVVGGVERMMSLIMNDMVGRGHDVSLMTLDPQDATSFYALDENIDWHKIDIGDPTQKASILTKIHRARHIRRRIKDIDPDVIIAFQDGPFRSTRLYTAFTGIPVIAAERNSPSRFDFIKAGKKRFVIYNAFRFAARITVQCESYREKYPAYLRDKIEVIPNPVLLAKAHAQPAGNDSNDTKTILSVGRLTYQKNYGTLIAAFAKIAVRFPDWRLVIVGEGDDRAKLEKMISNLDLQERILLEGETHDVSVHYTTSHVFCLSSLWEGFPNALAEAMSHGLPGIGFSDCDGIRDLIEDGHTGLLAEGRDNVDTLSQSLAALMVSTADREKMGAAAIKAVKKYDPALIFDMWENLFKHLENA